jgi:hypothetical protein
MAGIRIERCREKRLLPGPIGLAMMSCYQRMKSLTDIRLLLNELLRDTRHGMSKFDIANIG